MTTTITLITHGWPVKVTTTDRYSADRTSGGAQQHVVTNTTTTETVAPDSSRSFYITDARSIAFDELPAPPAPEPDPTLPTDGSTPTPTRERIR